MRCLTVILSFVGCCTAFGGQGTRITVLTYNIHHGEGTDGKLDLERIASIIASTDPDVVCLQEVDRNLARTDRLDFPALLAEKLKMDVRFEANYRFDGGEYGNATLTRLPVVASENRLLPNPYDAEPRGCLRVTVRVGESVMDILNTHLGLRGEERVQQAAAILEHIRDVPTVLAGDLNEEGHHPALQQLLACFSDSVSTLAGSHAGTSPSSDPKRRIDYILVSTGVDVLSSRVLRDPQTETASDHLPYWAELRLPGSVDEAEQHGIYEPKDERLNEALE